MRYKVLFLASWYPNKFHSIEGIFVKKQAKAVSNYCDVAVLSIKPAEQAKDYDLDYEIEDGVRTVRVYYKPGKVPVLGKFISLFKYLKSAHIGLKVIKQQFGKPDISHVNVIWPAGLIALILYTTKGIPYIITEHSTIYLAKDGSYKRKAFFEKFLIFLTVKKAKAVTVVSRTLKEAMLSHGFSNRYYVIPNVIDTTGETGQEQINQKKRKIVHISLLCKQKNILTILSTLKSILGERDDFEFHIIGDGQDRKKLEQLAQDLGLLNTYVFFHGMLSNEEVYRFLASSDFLITNSNYETFSVATAEALACGVPVIATRCGGPEDYVNEQVGILIEPGNSKQLKEAILHMLDNCDKYDKQEIREYAIAKFNSEVIGKSFYEVYKSILTI